MPNAKTDAPRGSYRILLAGSTGSGKTTQMWSLPGRKFAYLFDPNALRSLEGCDIDYELFLPDTTELDSTLKGFNKGAKDDRPPSSREPTCYMRWGTDLNERFENGFFDTYDWICIDGLTFLSKSIMDRLLYINNRFGAVEALSDYRQAGSKLTDLFRTLTSIGKNIYCTAHITSFQDEKTKKIEEQLFIPGSAKITIPLMFTDLFLAVGPSGEGKKDNRYRVQTRPDTRGFKYVRTSIRNLEFYEDVTIEDFNRPEDFGIGALLRRS